MCSNQEKNGQLRKSGYNFTTRGELLMNFLKDYEKEIKLPLSQQKIIEINKL